MKTPLLTTAVLALCLTAGRAAIPVPGSIVYTQDFNVLDTETNASTSVKKWADESTIPGWILYRAGAGGTELAGAVGPAYTYRVSDGVAGLGNTLADTGHFYSIGSIGNTDRALGAVSITAKGEHSIISVFQNTSGLRVRLTNIAYQAEVWRTNQNASVVETIAVSWKKGTTQAEFLTNTTATATAADWPAALSTGPTGPFVTGWNQVPGAYYTHSNTLANTRLNPPVIQSVTAVPASEILLEPGEFLAVRWGNINDSGADAIMGIDDVALTFTAEDTGVTATASAVTRDDNGSQRDPSDDLISATLAVDTTGAGTGWVVTSPASLTDRSGPFGAPFALTGVPVTAFSGSPPTLSIRVADQANPAAFATMVIQAPQCQINTVTASGFAYMDKGTPDVTDDEVTYSITADGIYTGSTFTIAPPGTAIPYATPTPITLPPPGTNLTHTLTDGADPACTASISVFPPAIIGSNETAATAVPVISEPIAAAATLPWVINAAAVTLVQNNSTVQADHIVLSQPVSLPGTGDILFTATLTATTGASSGFETADQFGLDLIIDGAAAVSALGASDTDNNGWLSYSALTPADELQAAINTTRTFDFAYIIPAGATSARVRITGNSNSSAETFTLSAIRFSIPPPSITVSDPANLRVNANGPGPADDTVSFEATIAGSYGGTGWIATGVIPASGLFGTVTFTLPLGAATATIRATDDTLPAVFEEFTLALPFPMGTVTSPAESSLFYTAVTPAAAPEWSVSGNQPEFRMNGSGLVAPLKTVESAVIILPAGVSAWQFTANLHVNDTSSGFEATDEFDAWLIVDGDDANPVSLITPHNTNGGTRLTGEELCPAHPDIAMADFDYPLSATLLTGTTTVQIIFTGLCNSPNETMTVSSLLLAPVSGNVDSDGDGVSDTDEDTMGTLPNDASSVLRLTATPGGISFPTATGRYYRLYASSTTAGAEGTHLGIWYDQGSSITGDGSIATIPIAPVAGAPRRFYRLHVKKDDLDWPAQVP